MQDPTPPTLAPLATAAMNWAHTPTRWQGAALGTEVALILDAPRLEAEVALRHAENTLLTVQSLFNLFDDSSSLQQLNLNGTLPAPSAAFLDLCEIATRLHIATGGLFDPTIQPLWRAMYNDEPLHVARQHIGWKHVEISPNAIKVAPDQQISFNGVAQGFATDMLCAALRELGITQALIQLGELAALGGPATIELSHPLPSGENSITLHDNSLSLSLPSKIKLGTSGHILHPFGKASDESWAWVAVEASKAAIADGASTAFTMMTVAEIEKALLHLPEVSRVRLLDAQGQETELRQNNAALT